MKFRGDFQLPDDFQYPTVLNSDEITREVRAMMFAKALRKANLVILDRETVKLAVRWGEFVEDYGSDTAWTMTYDAPALKQMQDALGDADA